MKTVKEDILHKLVADQQAMLTQRKLLLHISHSHIMNR